MKNKTWAYVACMVMFSVMAGHSSAAAGAPVWGVYLPGLPKKVSTSLADEDAVFYILKQTHEPLFRMDDGENFSSRILKKWSRSVDSSKYVFCPDTGQKFDEKQNFSLDYFETYLLTVTRRYSPDFSIVRSGECLDVSFKKKKTGYLNFLTRYVNAPTLGVSENVELGLGPFSVENIGKNEIVLKRKKSVAKGYERISLWEYVDFSGNLERKDLSDFNRVPYGVLPETVSERFLSFESVPLKSSGLILTSPDKTSREILYNCFDISGFRQAAFPNSKQLYDIQTLLPMGIPGGHSGRPQQECRNSYLERAKTLKPFILANWRKESRVPLEAFAAKFHSKTGIRIKIKQYEVQELVKTLFVRPHPYDMVLINFSVVQPEYDIFFRDFLVKDSLVDFNMPELTALLEKMVKEEEGPVAAGMAERIADGLGKRYAVLPLFQEVEKFYYPENIKNLIVGKGFTEYPEVAEFRW
ncbi:MAG: hypothetical protein WCK75_07340 [Elusimicrobiota bacterium]